MDSFTLKKSFIWVMLLLLCGMTLKAANNPQVVVKLDKPGSLISKVSFYTTNLKVIGSLDGKDMYSAWATVFPSSCSPAFWPGSPT